MYLRYIKNSVWRFLLCCVMSWSLAQMCFLGFYIRPEQQYNVPLLIAIVVILNAALWLVSFGKKTMLGGLIGFIAAILIAFLYLRISGNLTLAFSDKEDDPNPYLYYMICFAVVVGIWLLAATRRGTFVCMILGIFIAALIQFLYHNNQTLWLALFLVCCMVNLALKNYQNNVLKYRNQKISFLSVTLVSLVCVLVVLAVGCGAFYGIVKPLDPPVQKVQLFEREMAQNVVDKVGLAKEVKILDPSLTTDQTDETLPDSSSRQSDTNKEGDADNAGQQEDKDAAADESMTRFNRTAIEDALNVISYPHLEIKTRRILLICVIVLAVAAIVLKVLSHRIWLMAVQKKPKKEQIAAMYHLFLRKFKQIKEGKNREETPYEYAEREEINLSSFITQQTDFMEVTDIFVRSEYGADEVSEEDYGKVIDFYRHLFRLLRQYMGFRWILKFFVL